MAENKSGKVADLLKQRIREGLYARGGPLPSIAVLGEELGVSPSTVALALDLLHAQGLVGPRSQGRRRHVVDPAAPHVHLSVAERIRAGIASGRYPADAPLPGELELASALGCSRYAVREALRELEHTGEVRYRSGRARTLAGVSDAVDTLHEKAKAALLADIDAGRLAVGAQVGTEHELAARFGVHRLTARRALIALEKDGVLSRGANGRRLVAAAKEQTP